jgi:hypothetical protein
MKKEEVISEAGKPILRPLGIIGVLFILSFLSSPFVWIWKDFSLATKFGLTGFLGTLMIYCIIRLVRSNIGEGIDEALEKNKTNNPKSAFQLRLEEMQKQKEEAKSKNN